MGSMENPQLRISSRTWTVRAQYTLYIWVLLSLRLQLHEKSKRLVKAVAYSDVRVFREFCQLFEHGLRCRKNEEWGKWYKCIEPKKISIFSRKPFGEQSGLGPYGKRSGIYPLIFGVLINVTFCLWCFVLCCSQLKKKINFRSFHQRCVLFVVSPFFLVRN